MDEDLFRKKPRLVMIASQPVFIVSMFVLVTTLLAVWLLNPGRHRTLCVNSLLSVSLLSFIVLCFIVKGFYNGVRLKDTIGRFRISRSLFAGFLKKVIRPAGKRKRRRSGASGWGTFPDVSAGCFSLFDDALVWLVAAVAALSLLWLLGNLLWACVLVFIAMLYGVFFRALRLVFRKSALCRGHFGRNLWYGIYYTFLYNCRIYFIIIATHLLLP